ncbi:hypothetical protein vBPmiSPMCJR_019 [Proteus phage vB_PmiS_PM-CJR]|nr:hypothetical protein vBPmiSPMCJR_019 [Proteus phage vB_PmiS_PM-CJR]
MIKNYCLALLYYVALLSAVYGVVTLSIKVLKLVVQFLGWILMVTHVSSVKVTWSV